MGTNTTLTTAPVAGSCLGQPRALSPPHMAGQKDREGRRQLAESEAAKPVEASGAGTPQKEAWPKASEICQDASPGCAQHQAGEGSSCHPRLLLAESPAGPPAKTQQHLRVVSDHPVSDSYDHEQQTWVGPHGGLEIPPAPEGQG